MAAIVPEEVERIRLLEERLAAIETERIHKEEGEERLEEACLAEIEIERLRQELAAE